MAKKREITYKLFNNSDSDKFEEREGYLEYLGQSTKVNWFTPEGSNYPIPVIEIFAIAVVSDKETGEFHAILVQDIKEKLNAESRGSNEHGA